MIYDFKGVLEKFNELKHLFPNEARVATCLHAHPPNKWESRACLHAHDRTMRWTKELCSLCTERMRKQRV